MIVNELAGSGGDAFPCSFIARIGPIVGTRTWGGLVGIFRGIPLHDGGNVTAPEFAFWSRTWWRMDRGNHGVDQTTLWGNGRTLSSAAMTRNSKSHRTRQEALKSYKGLPPRPKYPVVKE